MASLPPLKRLLIEAFPSQKAWIPPLLLVINNFQVSVVSAFNKAITINDNTTGSVLSITLSAVPTSASPASIQWPGNIVPNSVIVSNVQLLSGNSFTLTDAVQVQWQMSSPTTLQIIGVTGIVPTLTNSYVLTLVCFTG